MAKLVVRRIRPDDAPLIRAVRLRALATDPSSFGSTYEREVAYPDERWREWATGDSEGDEMTTLLAFRDGEPVGVVMSARDDDEPTVYGVYAMWVAPEARREGLGRWLLTELERWIGTAGGTIARLSVTNEAVAARRLYESAGYEPDGRRRDSRHTPGLLEIGLEKRL